MAPSRGRTSRNQQPPTKSRKVNSNHSPSSSSASTHKDVPPIPFELQQTILDTFISAFNALLSPSNIQATLFPLLQEVKGHLYNRDFESAFSRRDYLEVYAVRWSVSRALGYLELLQESFDLLLAEPAAEAPRPNDDDDTRMVSREHSDELRRVINIACLGGGAAEVCALGGILNLYRTLDESVSASTSAPVPTYSRTRPTCPSLNVHLYDIADWSSVIDCLTAQASTSHTSPSHTSVAVPSVLSTSNLTTNFTKVDLLSPSSVDEISIELEKADLITLAFTLNELYTTSLSKTQKLLLRLTACVRNNALLLVVDSPGSYSTVTINGSRKRYPMEWLLKHTLLKIAPDVLSDDVVDTVVRTSEVVVEDGEAESAVRKISPAEKNPLWECVSTTPSHWFRLPQGLKYPLELENMRYQMHLFRRV